MVCCPWQVAGYVEVLPAVCTFVLEVVDREKPTITCLDNESLVLPTDEGMPTVTRPIPSPIVVDYGDDDPRVYFRRQVPGEASNSPAGVIWEEATHSMSTNATFEVGAHPLKFTVEDAHGNTASCEATVYVEDREPPILVCPEAEARYPADEGAATAVVELGAATMTDNFAVAPTGSGVARSSVLKYPGRAYPIGVTVLAYSGADVFGKSPTAAAAFASAHPCGPRRRLLTPPHTPLVNGPCVAPGVCGPSRVTWATDACTVRCGLLLRQRGHVHHKHHRRRHAAARRGGVRHRHGSLLLHRPEPERRAPRFRREHQHHAGRVRAVSRQNSPQWESIRLRPLAGTYASWGARVDEPAKSRKIPTGNICTAPLCEQGRGRNDQPVLIDHAADSHHHRQRGRGGRRRERDGDGARRR